MMWIILAPISLLLSALAFPLAPFIVLFTSKEGVSPTWAWPWLTFDNPIDGDAGHLERWPSDKPLLIYFRRVAWLWRNKAYNASYHWLGRVLSSPPNRKGNSKVGNRPLVKGWSFEYDNKGVWEFYAVYPYTSSRCLRIRLGWKINENAVEGDRVMLVTHISPFMGYSK